MLPVTSFGAHSDSPAPQINWSMAREEEDEETEAGSSETSPSNGTSFACLNSVCGWHMAIDSESMGVWKATVVENGMAEVTCWQALWAQDCLL